MTVLTVNPGQRVAIPGIASAAVWRMKGDVAEVAILTAHLLVAPRLMGAQMEFAGQSWTVFDWRAEGPICIYRCRKAGEV